MISLRMLKPGALTLLLLAFLAGCGPTPADLDAQATTIVSSVLATITAQAPTPTVAAATPTPSALPATGIFAQVAPSVVFIETPHGTGSGAVIEDGYVLTNAHVVWPFEEVRVVFPDGSEYANAAVARYDMMADLAVIGPLDTMAAPLTLVDGEDLPVGSDVYLLGYPGEEEDYPQPTLARGIISRQRQWEPIDLTYFQTDAAIAGGQSGGVLVSARGEVIGVSGFVFADTYGLVASAADILPRLEGLIAGKDVDGLGDRNLPQHGGKRIHTFALKNYWDTFVAIVNASAGTEVAFEVKGRNDHTLYLVDMNGKAVIESAEPDQDTQSGSTTLEMEGPYVLTITQAVEDANNYRLESNHELAPFRDPDDRAFLTIGDRIAGAIDYPGDQDYFQIGLKNGQRIEISADSVLIDPHLTVDFGGAAEDEIVTDDDSGGGLFGLEAVLTYEAPHAGLYYIVVEDTTSGDIGGYFLSVARCVRMIYRNSTRPNAISPAGCSAPPTSCTGVKRSPVAGS